MDDYLHQDWKEEDYSRVAEAIVAAIPQREIINMVLERSKDTKMNDLLREKLSGGKSSRSSVSSNPMNDSSEDLVFSSEKTAAPSKAEESVFENTESSDDDEYDSLFKNL
jgi:hypothetical protein